LTEYKLNQNLIN